MSHHRCDECGNTFINKSGLTRHKLTHIGLKPFTCEVCQKTFTRQWNLTAHIEYVHVQKKKYKCDVCGCLFRIKSSLTRHTLVAHTHSKSKSFACKVCGCKYVSKQSLTKHMYNIHERTYKCNVCDEQLTSKDGLKEHMKSHPETKKSARDGAVQHVCKQCNMCFSVKSNLTRHVMKDSCMKPQVCRHCNKPFADAYKLQKHSCTLDSDSPYQCEKCPKSFNRAKRLSLHLRTHRQVKQRDICHITFSLPVQGKMHRCGHVARGGKTDITTVDNDVNIAGNIYKCTICRKSFSAKSNLKKHMEVHTDETLSVNMVKEHDDAISHKRNITKHLYVVKEEKTLVCKICQRSYAAKSSLKRHLTVHREENQIAYRCKKCPKTFSRAVGLSLHMRTHRQIKEHDRCHRTFSQPVQGKRHRCGLVAHVRKTDITPVDTDVNIAGNIYKCTICRKSFSVKSNLKKHMEVHTDEKLSVNIVKADEDVVSHKRNITNHPYIVKEKKTFVCKICQRSYADKSSLKRHLTVHSEENQITCNVGEDHVYNEITLSACSGQDDTTEENEKVQACTVCSKTYATISGLRRHMAVHDSETRLECEICEVFFTDINHLLRHMQIHTWENALNSGGWDGMHN